MFGGRFALRSYRLNIGVIMQDPWNSLEITKIAISASIPMIVVVVGYILNRNIKKLDKKHWTNQKILEKRLIIYDEIVPILNDILCFHCYIGNWKDIPVAMIIKNKRILDKEINIYAPLFPDDIVAKYNTFIAKCYQTNTGWGNDAKINSSYIRRSEFSNEWNDEDIQYFSEDYLKVVSINSDKEHEFINEKKKTYFELIDSLCLSLEIMQNSGNRKIENPSINFHH